MSWQAATPSRPRPTRSASHSRQSLNGTKPSLVSSKQGSTVSEPLFSGAASNDAESRFLMGSSDEVDKLFDTEKALLALVRKLQGNVNSLQEQLGEQEKQLFSERSAKEEALRKADESQRLTLQMKKSYKQIKSERQRKTEEEEPLHKMLQTLYTEIAHAANGHLPDAMPIEPTLAWAETVKSELQRQHQERETMDALQMANDQLIDENGGLQMRVVQAKKDLEAYKQRHHALREQHAQQEKKLMATIEEQVLLLNNPEKQNQIDVLRGVTKRQSIRITQLLAVLQANQIHLPEIESEYPGSPTLRTTTASSVESEEYQAALTAQVAVLHQKLKDHRTTILQLTTSLEQHQRLVKEKGECIADLENESVGIRAQLDTFRGAEGTWIKEKQALSNKLVVYAQRMRVAMQERDRCQKEIKAMQKQYTSDMQSQESLELKTRDSEQALRRLLQQLLETVDSPLHADLMTSSSSSSLPLAMDADPLQADLLSLQQTVSNCCHRYVQQRASVSSLYDDINVLQKKLEAAQAISDQSQEMERLQEEIIMLRQHLKEARSNEKGLKQSIEQSKKHWLDQCKEMDVHQMEMLKLKDEIKSLHAELQRKALIVKESKQRQEAMAKDLEAQTLSLETGDDRNRLLSQSLQSKDVLIKELRTKISALESMQSRWKQQSEAAKEAKKTILSTKEQLARKEEELHKLKERVNVLSRDGNALREKMHTLPTSEEWLRTQTLLKKEADKQKTSLAQVTQGERVNAQWSTLASHLLTQLQRLPYPKSNNARAEALFYQIFGRPTDDLFKTSMLQVKDLKGVVEQSVDPRQAAAFQQVLKHVTSQVDACLYSLQESGSRGHPADVSPPDLQKPAFAIAA